MSLYDLRDILAWCTIINGAVLLVWLFLSAFASDWMYALQSRWFPLERAAWNKAVYLISGLYKILWLTFNLVPFIAASLAANT
jgi:hypothetical protein